MAKIWKIDAAQPDAKVIATAAGIIRRGGVVVVPTSGLYGLAGDALNADAHRRIFKIKARPTGKALLLLISDTGVLEQVSAPLRPTVLHLMERFRPGGVTFVVPAHPVLPLTLTGGSGKIGVRLVAHSVVAGLIRAVGRPLTGTSANISGSGGCADIAQMDPGLLNHVDGVLDAGALAGGPGSTVVDVNGSSPKILREGAVPANAIKASFEDFRDRKKSAG